MVRDLTGFGRISTSDVAAGRLFSDQSGNIDQSRSGLNKRSLEPRLAWQGGLTMKGRLGPEMGQNHLPAAYANML